MTTTRVNGFDDLGIDLRLATCVLNAVEQQNLADFANRRRKDRTADRGAAMFETIYPVLQEMRPDLRSRDPRVWRPAFRSLLRAFRFLVESGYTLFEPFVQVIEVGMEKIHRAARDEVVRRFLSPASSDEDVEIAGRLLVELIESGGWPNWREEYEREVQKRCSTALSK
jgi:hypothetical protein